MTPPRTTPPGSVVFASFRERARFGKVRFARGAAAKKPVAIRAQPARVARMLALAHHLEAAIHKNELEGPSDIARRVGITDARVTQVLGLVYLAPDIQEDVLFLETHAGRKKLTESKLRKISRVLDWSEQRRLYARFRSGLGDGSTAPDD